MKTRCFIDTNVLVYFRDGADKEKQQRASDWLAYLRKTTDVRISTQVISEYYVTVSRKLKPGLDDNQAWNDVRRLLAWKPIPIDSAVIRKAHEIQTAYGFSWWDSLVAGAALLDGCTHLLTEDLQHGQQVDGMEIVDPFQKEPQ